MFKASRALAMQPTRMLFMRRSPQLLMRQSPQMWMRQTVRMMRPVPKEEQTAHTISQRLRTLKRIPAEIYPLLFVLAAAVCFAIFSLVRKLMVDKTLRLKRQGGNE
ncbi:uncharacterized protein EI97DRAFT_469736 [Westerdykella ornata]|uniref:Uncharacterized protein n=1 Tax=Westerdykella ornata TaxID=318751 RepID=A0A6A6JAC3_WESOR|nr:uncharacterized protein EI97DRAFT_469736 [Westerdykella ornata]KAF2273352.1 hypothetical protein EI97DRAFT_469736 [Westerdykella ornata]